jgi:hypothetical protein
MSEMFRRREARRLIEKEINWSKKRKLFLVFTPHLPYLKARMIESKAELLSIMELSGLKAFLIEENIDMEILKEFLKEEKVIPVSNDPRLFSFETGFLSYLEEANKEADNFSKAVKKITGEVAERLHIEDRGMIEEGKYADLVLYNNGRVEKVWVNGEEEYDAAEMRENISGKAGKVLFRSRYNS